MQSLNEQQMEKHKVFPKALSPKQQMVQPR